jgi:phosphomannomutase
MLMRTVSGLRGIVGSDLTPDVLVRHLRAFLQVTGARKIAVGRDSRITGPAVDRVICSACELAGVDVVELGLATTPTVELAVETLGCGGGIIITASHNPSEWNALKFLTKDGTFLVAEQIEQLNKLADAGQFDWQPWDKIGSIDFYQGGDADHIKATLALPYIDADLIRSKKFKVAVDAVNGAGSSIFPQLLRELGCEVTAIYCSPDGKFPRHAEPIPTALGDLGKAVRDNGCVVGFALDPDADRCALVSETGRAVGEEYTLAMALDLVLGKAPGDAAVNLSTSRMNDEVAVRYGRKVLKAKVGEINVTQVIRANKCVIGGEGNGGVILPALHCGRDGIVAAALVLQWLAEKGQTLEQFVASLKPYEMAKGKLDVVGLDIDAIFAAMRKAFPGAEESTLDGLRLDMADGWVHVRKSNTEPIVRVMSESHIPGRAEAIQQQASAAIAAINS